MRLIYLLFASNTAYCTVSEDVPKGVTVDMERGVWRYVHAELNQAVPIGRARYVRHARGGVIGVYDRDSIGHLDSMVHDALASQSDHTHAD